MKKHTIRLLICRTPLVFALGSFAVAAHAASAVTAPPLPLGSDMIRVEAGLNPEEVKRQKRAHSHSKLQKKDPTLDDTVPVSEPKKTP